VILFAQPLCSAYINAHVDKESHAFPLDRVHFLGGKPSRLFNGLLDTFGLQIRVAFQDLFKSSVVGDLAYDHRNRNAHATDACPSPMIFGSKVIRSNICYYLWCASRNLRQSLVKYLRSGAAHNLPV
jgi:hypothetical protein